MKKILSAILLCVGVGLFVPGKAQAVGTQVPDYMYQTCVSSMTINKVLVSSSVTSGFNTGLGITNQMDTPALVNRVTIWVQNNSSAANLWCNTDTTKMASGGGVGNGFEIGTSTSTSVPPFIQIPLAYTSYQGPILNATNNNLHFYCVNDGAVSSTATVVQCY